MFKNRLCDLPEAVRQAVFAAPIGVSADADPQTRLLAIAGRQS